MKKYLFQQYSIYLVCCILISMPVQPATAQIKIPAKTTSSGTPEKGSAEYWRARQKRMEQEAAIEGYISDDELAGVDAQNAERYDEAERLMKKALAAAQEHYGEASFKVAFLTSRLADIYKDWNRLGDAEKCYKHAIVIYNTVVSSDREQMWQPLDAWSGMLQGGHVRGNPVKRKYYVEWIARSHPGEAERQALVDKLENLRNHMAEMLTLDPSWGTVQAQRKPAQDTFLGELRSKIQKTWKWNLTNPGKQATIVVIISEGYRFKPDLDESSGSKSFDDAALNAVEAARPYPPPPDQADKITVEVVFDSSGPGMPRVRANY